MTQALRIGILTIYPFLLASVHGEAQSLEHVDVAGIRRGVQIVRSCQDDQQCLLEVTKKTAQRTEISSESVLLGAYLGICIAYSNNAAMMADASDKVVAETYCTLARDDARDLYIPLDDLCTITGYNCAEIQKRLAPLSGQ